MRTRTLRELLALPATQAEKRQADAHIKAETARIRAGWSEREHRQRAGLTPEPEPWRFPVVDGRWLGLDE